VDSPDRKEKLKFFFEDVGLLFEQWGMPRMAGRILGWLMVSDPAQQTAAQLAEVLGASKGSISTNIRLLVQSGIIEKVGLPGERSAFYQLSDDPMQKLMHMEISSIRSMRQMAERGLDILKDRSFAQRSRLQELHGVWSFFEREFPNMLERYYNECRDKGDPSCND
jgi:DNA-binding transcriptional regulator GbsR (MarR family)